MACRVQPQCLPLAFRTFSFWPKRKRLLRPGCSATMSCRPAWAGLFLSPGPCLASSCDPVQILPSPPPLEKIAPRCCSVTLYPYFLTNLGY